MHPIGILSCSFKILGYFSTRNKKENFTVKSGRYAVFTEDFEISLWKTGVT